MKDFSKNLLIFFITKSISLNDYSRIPECHQKPILKDDDIPIDDFLYSSSVSTEAIVVTICLKVPLLALLIFLIYQILPKGDSKPLTEESPAQPYTIDASLPLEQRTLVLPSVTVTTLESSESSSEQVLPDQS